MKKLLYALFITCICICFPQVSSAQLGGGVGGGIGIGGGGGWRPPVGGGIIDGDVDIKPGNPTTLPGGGRPRSIAVDVVDAWIDFDFGQIAVTFNQEIGTVTIAITDVMGRTWTTYNCDTTYEFEVWLPLPNAIGHYMITIVGEEYTGSGEFDLQ